MARLKVTKGLGARYGLRIRRLVEQAEQQYKHKRLECPRCHKQALKRVAAGIWECRNCGYKFAAGAYTPRRILTEAFEKTLQEKEKA
ncbi:MAG: 50S ribosomal protein L37ae [bacterium]|nr:50S ribosomal protein L37ae [bacterium]